MTRTRESGITLSELLITLSFGAVLALALGTVLLGGGPAPRGAREPDERDAVRAALGRLASDVRAARPASGGGGPAVRAADSLEIVLALPAGDGRDEGARELVRWTLDLDRDGDADSLDAETPLGSAAARTGDPHARVLVRETAPGEAGPRARFVQSERVAVVAAPGTETARGLFEVWLAGDARPWDWSRGAIPSARLAEIERVVVRLVPRHAAPAATVRAARAEFVASVRPRGWTAPVATPLERFEGRVLEERAASTAGGPARAPLGDFTLVLDDRFATTTDSDGRFVFRVPAGEHALRVVSPAGYDGFRSDTLRVRVPEAAPRILVARPGPGGWIEALAFHDRDGDGIRRNSEPGVRGAWIRDAVTGLGSRTDADGRTRLYVRPGPFALAASFEGTGLLSDAAIRSGTMGDGDASALAFAGRTPERTALAGIVFDDRDADGRRAPEEPGRAGVWVGVTRDGGLTYLASARTDARGEYVLRLPPGTPDDDALALDLGVPDGTFPTTPVHRAAERLESVDFGVRDVTFATLEGRGARALLAGRLRGAAVGGDDLLLASDAPDGEPLRAWWNDARGDAPFRSAPSAVRLGDARVRAVAAGALRAAPGVRAADLVLGLAAGTGDGPNLEIWSAPEARAAGGIDGAFATSTRWRSFRTRDGGDVSAVALLDCSGGALPDVVIATAGGRPGAGSLEVWTQVENADLAFERREVGAPRSLGEAIAFATADWDGDGDADLAVATRAVDGACLVRVFENSRPDGLRWRADLEIPDAEFTALAALDVDGDGRSDLVAATKRGRATGGLAWWRTSRGPEPWAFEAGRRVETPGLVRALAVADFGGAPGEDLVVAFAGAGGGEGGVRIYYTDSGTLPFLGADPFPPGFAHAGDPAALAAAAFEPAAAGSGVSARDLAVAFERGPVVVLTRPLRKPERRPPA